MSTTRSIDFGVLLNLAFGVFKDQLHRHLANVGFDDIGTSFGYVFRILETSSLSLRQVAEHLDMTPQGALKIINDMVAKGYVKRLDDPRDGRVKRLMLTARALKAIDHARRFHARFEQDLGKRVGERQARALRAGLEDITVHHAESAPRLRPL